MRFAQVASQAWLGVAGMVCMSPVVAAPPNAAPTAVTARTADMAQGSSVIPGLGASVGKSLLANLSGGTEVTQTITIDGNVSNNNVVDVSTGFNSISGGAFGNAAGLPMVIQNSGNSVLIQNATVVNLQLQP